MVCCGFCVLVSEDWIVYLLFGLLTSSVSVVVPARALSSIAVSASALVSAASVSVPSAVSSVAIR